MNKNKIIIFFLFALSFLLFVQDLSRHGIEYRDDEIFYFNSTREMLASRDFLSPTYFGEDRFQKPILFYWLILLSYQILGAGWFAARFVAVVFASLTVCLTYIIARDFFGKRVAAVSSLVLVSIPLFFRHAKDAVPDMALNFFIVTAFYCLWRFYSDRQDQRYKYLFFVSCALGFMIKGFAALIIPIAGLIAFFVIHRTPREMLRINFPAGLLILAVIILPWFIYMINVHGETYTQYVVQAETINRLVSHEHQNPAIKFFSTFRTNSVFYLKTLLSYFAPWSVFAFFGIPWSIRRAASRIEGREGYVFLNVWFWTAFLFFSVIFAKINHLILVLSTPFAILVSCFLVHEFDQKQLWARGAEILKELIFILILAVGTIGLALLKVFLIGSSPWWLLVFTAILVGGGILIIRSPTNFQKALVLGLFLVFSYTQTGLVSRAGLTGHSTLQRLAETIHAQADEYAVVGVGSHDIHEKELQVYFDRQVEKAATSNGIETMALLRKFFAADKDVYCVLLKGDYEKLLNESYSNKIDIIQEDFIARRRVRIDSGFFKALLNLDSVKVRGYLMEKVVLVRKAQA